MENSTGAGDFVTAARAEFSFLERNRGFRLGRTQTIEGAGDAVVDFESATLRVRVLRDRGQVFLDVAPTEGHAAGGTPTWFDLPILLEFLGAGDAATALLAGGQRDVRVVARLLQAHYDGIAGALGGPQAATVTPRLDQLRRARADARFGGPDR